MKKIVALHGFLGQVADWEVFDWNFLHGIDLYSLNWHNLPKCAQELNAQFSQEKPILMGYSLGGRLALHALIDQPARWQAAIIISAHPGLVSAQSERIKSDEDWARRFEEEAWPSLMQAWNGRAAFAQDGFTFDRHEHDYQRQQLATILRNGSLGKQEHLVKSIENLPFPILWITGQKDRTYTDLAAQLCFKNSNSKKVIIPEAGHRAPWEKPLFFKQFVDQFLEKVIF
jgi:2-succinyl-6-hydroxy-2,4-cyclohexadiene-1-carboxylate synthase